MRYTNHHNLNNLNDSNAGEMRAVGPTARPLLNLGSTIAEGFRKPPIQHFDLDEEPYRDDTYSSYSLLYTSN